MVEHGLSMGTAPGFHTQHPKTKIGSLLAPSPFRALCSKNEVQQVLVMASLCAMCVVCPRVSTCICHV